jgi:beta-N-acetylhexosaminidase
MVALLLHQRARAARPRPAASSGAVSQRLSAAGITSVAGACSGRLVGRQVRVTGPASAVGRFRSAARAAGLRVARKKGTRVRLVGYDGRAVRGDVVVALDTPYVLGRSRARLAKVATYGDTSGAMHALVAVLLGRARAPGRLPVEVAGVSRPGC